jgi:hypothetical protein
MPIIANSYTNLINEFFPIAGRDNDPQVFRDNFNDIKNALTDIANSVTWIASNINPIIQTNYQLQGANGSPNGTTLGLNSASISVNGGIMNIKGAGSLLADGHLIGGLYFGGLPPSSTMGSPNDQQGEMAIGPNGINIATGNYSTQSAMWSKLNTGIEENTLVVGKASQIYSPIAPTPNVICDLNSGTRFFLNNPGTDLALNFINLPPTPCQVEAFVTVRVGPGRTDTVAQIFVEGGAPQVIIEHTHLITGLNPTGTNTTTLYLGHSGDIGYTGIKNGSAIGIGITPASTVNGYGYKRWITILAMAKNDITVLSTDGIFEGQRKTFTPATPTVQPPPPTPPTPTPPSIYPTITVTPVTNGQVITNYAGTATVLPSDPVGFNIQTTNADTVTYRLDSETVHTLTVGSNIPESAMASYFAYTDSTVPTTNANWNIGWTATAITSAQSYLQSKAGPHAFTFVASNNTGTASQTIPFILGDIGAHKPPRINSFDISANTISSNDTTPITVSWDVDFLDLGVTNTGDSYIKIDTYNASSSLVSDIVFDIYPNGGSNPNFYSSSTLVNSGGINYTVNYEVLPGSVTAEVPAVWTPGGLKRTGSLSYFVNPGSRANVPAGPQWYPVSRGEWNSFQQQYAVWTNSNQSSPIGTSVTSVRYFNVTTPGTYTLSATCDDLLEIYIDDSTSPLLSIRDDFSTNDSPHTISGVLTAGQHKLTMIATNTGGPGGFGITITDPSNTVIWDTRSNLTPVQPTPSQPAPGNYTLTLVAKNIYGTTSSSVSYTYNSIQTSTPAIVNEEIVPSSGIDTSLAYYPFPNAVITGSPFNVNIINGQPNTQMTWQIYEGGTTPVPSSFVGDTGGSVTLDGTGSGSIIGMVLFSQGTDYQLRCMFEGSGNTRVLDISAVSEWTSYDAG